MDKKESKLKYVRVYDALYDKIKDGTYPKGSQLPSENVLSAEMNISRMTLRKALTLLHEDGLIKNVQGVGNFVKNNTEKIDNSEEKNIHPIYSYCTEKIDSVEFEFRIEPPTKSIIDAMDNRYMPAVVITDRWYKCGPDTVAYTLSFVPIDVIAESKIDLNEKDQLLEYLEKRCYNEMKTCKRICSHSSAGNFSAINYRLSEDDSFLLVYENIIDQNNRIIINNKHYIPLNLFRIEIDL